MLVKKNQTFVEFVRESLIGDLEKMINVGLQYYAFPIICQATEAMGSFYDSYDFDASGDSDGARFRKALKELYKDSRYRNNQSEFYSYLRCSFAHQLRPGSKFYICSEKHDGVSKTEHLVTRNKKRIIVIEQFFDDFKAATERLQNDINLGKNGVDKKKALDPFLGVIQLPGLPTSYGSTGTPCVSGQVSTDFDSWNDLNN